MERGLITEEIDSSYIIKQKVGFGGTANAFLVIDKQTNKECVAKVLKEDFNVLFNNEKNILDTLKEYNNPYIINIIRSGEGDVVRNNRKTKKKKYCILEYAPYGNIFDYIYCKKEGFKEVYCKVIFSKIMKGIQCCHKHNICNRDIKITKYFIR